MTEDIHRSGGKANMHELIASTEAGCSGAVHGIEHRKCA